LHAKTLCNADSLLPPLQLPSIQLLEPAETLEVFVFVVVIIEIELAHLVEATGELPPGALPLDVARLAACPPEASSSADVVTPVSSSG
jgi:hypothetical protein